MILLLQRGSRGKGAAGLHPNPRRAASASLRTISLDDSEHLRHNQRVSVASLRLLFTFAPECRSASLRNRCSPSPEYPLSTSYLLFERYLPGCCYEPSSDSAAL